jgi:hypothetical protein
MVRCGRGARSRYATIVTGRASFPVRTRREPPSLHGVVSTSAGVGWGARWSRERGGFVPILTKNDCGAGVSLHLSNCRIRYSQFIST